MGLEPTTFCIASGSWVRPEWLKNRTVDRNPALSARDGAEIEVELRGLGS